jgi:hypothetical protein
VAKVEARRLIPRAKPYLEPLQMGVGSPLGTERIVRAAEEWSRIHRGTDKVLLKVDIRNAFNTVSRAALLDRTRLLFPEVVPWIAATYLIPAHLRHGGFTVLSEDGVQQGDPLGPLLFALALHPLALRIAREVPGLDVHKWYLDDGVLAGSAEDVRSALAIILAACPPDGRGELGLSVRLEKCELITCRANTDTSAFPPNIQVMDTNFELLGLPVGTEEHIIDYLRRKPIRKALDAIQAVCRLDDPQVAYALLRDCCAFPRVVHVLRSVPPRLTRQALTPYDAEVRAAMSFVIGADIPMSHWVTATWATSQGGFGLRSSSRHAPAGYVASTLECATLDGWDPRQLPDWQETIGLLNVLLPPHRRLDMYAAAETSLSLLKMWMEEEDARSYSSSHKGRGGDSSYQRVLSRCIDTHQREGVLADCPDEEHRAHLVAVGTADAGAWLRAIPSKGLMLALPPADFRAASLLRLHLISQPEACPHCDRPPPAPDNGRHLLSCKRAPGVVARHNALRNTLHEAITASGFSSALEVTAGGGKQRPGDVVMCGQPPTFIDVAVIHPLHPQYRSTRGRPVDNYAANIKVAKYGTRLREDGLLFCPFVADVFGNLCCEATHLLQRLGRARALRENEPPQQVMWHLRVRVSITIAACVAKMITSARGAKRSHAATAVDGTKIGPSTAMLHGPPPSLR